jgi:hypothetical protein
MADRSYTWPAALHTGSCSRASVMGHTCGHAAALAWAAHPHKPQGSRAETPDRTAQHTDTPSSLTPTTHQIGGRGEQLRVTAAAADGGGVLGHACGGALTQLAADSWWCVLLMRRHLGGPFAPRWSAAVKML